MDHSEAPVLAAIESYRESGYVPFTPPGHKQGRGTDPRVLETLGEGVFRSDMLAIAGMDDRMSSNGVLERAEELMADAVRADRTFFTTCGSSLSVKSAMLAVAGPYEKLLVGRDAHKSVVAGLILAGIRPIRVEPNYKMGSGLEQGSVFHQQGDLVDPKVLKGRADLLGTTSPSVLIYAGLDGWRRQMVQDGRRLLGAALDLARATRDAIDAIDGLRVHHDEFLGPDRAADVDPLQIIVDVSGLGLTGYQVADWLREHHRINLHVSDHRRSSAQLTHADDEQTAGLLVAALKDAAAHTAGFDPAPRVAVPDPPVLRLEQADLPRDAFFGRAEQVRVSEAAGRTAAEMLTPYPPGIPAALPGERLTTEILEYLRTGKRAGMVVPDAADPGLETIRVVTED